MTGGHFVDRRDAGRKLAPLLAPLALKRPLVLALPRGGVPVGYEVAKALGGHLDLLLVRKLGAPGQPELALGAINGLPDSSPVLNDGVVRLTNADPTYIAQETQRQRQELERRRLHYMGDRPLSDPHERDVVVVDDGIATGSTARAALLALLPLHPRRIILAIPVAAPDTLDNLRDLVDEAIAAIVPQTLNAVGEFYDNFSQTKDDEVIALLREWHH